ncbi:MAG TPA: DNA-formamidopyrimidine glycosylase family protein [Opitutaceae bacterium]|nr:DNA-formamidopyrimidine glycosylase family protein [Opitutaceae bacterium]
MPELAEVEFYRKRWQSSAARASVVDVLLHANKRLFRGIDPKKLRRALRGATFVGSEARAKQMLFRFRGETSAAGEIYLGIHLGMSGELRVEPAGYAPGRHDHLVIVTTATRSRIRPPLRQTAGRTGVPAAVPAHALVFNDPRMFGRILFHLGAKPPAWWTGIAPAILSDEFTVDVVGQFLQRRKRAPIKAVLLMQERFPGVGNWMADEILWRAAIHPARLAGSLAEAEIRRLHHECRHVCRIALATIAGRGPKPPPDLNVDIPDSWLFNHRWRKGGKDPITGTPLAHATIGGRTTCWSPARQKR